MDIGAIVIIIIIGGILVLTFYIIGLYNTLLDAENKVKDKFIKIDKELKKEIKYLPEIINLLKKNAKHEEKLIEEISSLEVKINSNNNINDKINLINDINKVLTKVYKLTETYPDLKKSRILNTIKKNIDEIENKINYAKIFYNDRVKIYENLKNTYPTNIIARIFKFKEINIIK